MRICVCMYVCVSAYVCMYVCVCVPLSRQAADHGEAVKSVLQKGFLGRDTEQLFPYGIYT